MQQLKKLGENLWVHETTMPLVAGTRLRLRMTLVKLTDGALWIHSPTALSPELKTEVENLGAVTYIIGPSNSHNLWLQEWHEAYPKATLYVSAGIPKKSALKSYLILDEFYENIWHEDLKHAYLQGASLFNESVFLHLASKSLLVTDLIQNHSDHRPTGIPGFITRFVFEPLGFKGICIAPHLKWGFVIQDKEIFSSVIRKILHWNFDRIIVTHGDIIEKNALQVFTDLCTRFLRQEQTANEN